MILWSGIFEGTSLNTVTNSTSTKKICCTGYVSITNGWCGLTTLFRKKANTAWPQLRNKQRCSCKIRKYPAVTSVFDRVRVGISMAFNTAHYIHANTKLTTRHQLCSHFAHQYHPSIRLHASYVCVVAQQLAAKSPALAAHSSQLENKLRFFSPSHYAVHTPHHLCRNRSGNLIMSGVLLAYSQPFPSIVLQCWLPCHTVGPDARRHAARNSAHSTRIETAPSPCPDQHKQCGCRQSDQRLRSSRLMQTWRKSDRPALQES